MKTLCFQLASSVSRRPILSTIYRHVIPKNCSIRRSSVLTKHLELLSPSRRDPSPRVRHGFPFPVDSEIIFIHVFKFTS